MQHQAMLVAMRITSIPCLSDNYAYLVEDPRTGIGAVVDASEAEPVRAAVEKAGTRLVAVLSTHHHHDHVGGNEALAAAFPGLRVYGHASDRGRLPGLTDPVEDGDAIPVGSLTFRVRHIPGHTLGAVAYIVEDAVFTGDTLFLAGCGRLFEGTPAQMYRSLNEVLAPLGPEVRVFCGHEYTVSNLAFARHVEPDNQAVIDRLEATKAQRDRGEPTMGSKMKEELATNPFLRTSSATIRKSVGLGPEASPIDVLAAVRKAKDGFRG